MFGFSYHDFHYSCETCNPGGPHHPFNWRIETMTTKPEKKVTKTKKSLSTKTKDKQTKTNTTSKGKTTLFQKKGKSAGKKVTVRHPNGEVTSLKPPEFDAYHGEAHSVPKPKSLWRRFLDFIGSDL